MYYSRNPLNVSEGGYSGSEWGARFQRAAANGSLHRTAVISQAVAADLYRPNLAWPPRDGMQRDARTSYYGVVPRVTNGFAGPVLLGPADINLYS